MRGNKQWPTIIVAVICVPVAVAQVKGGGTLDREQIAKMSFSEISSTAASYLKDMEQMTESVSNMVREAQDSKDFQRYHCLNGIFTMMKTIMKMVQETKTELRQAINTKDRVGTEHHFIKIFIARGKMAELEARAKGCGGPGMEAVFEGRTETEIVEEGVPTDDIKSGVTEPDFPVGMISPPPSGIPEGMPSPASPAL